MYIQRLRIWTTTLIALGALATAAAVVARAEAFDTARPARGFADPVGDTSRVPDIRHVAVSDSGGIVEFSFNVANLSPTPGATDDTWVVTDLDTNRDGQSDYYFYFGVDTTSRYWQLVKLPADKPVPRSSKMAIHQSGPVTTIELGSSDLGDALGFNFRSSAALAADDSTVWVDGAPDMGWWTYELTSITPELGIPIASPQTPVAGRPFTLRLPVTRSDTGAPPKAGLTASFETTISGAPVAHTQSVKGANASVHVAIPSSARGSSLRIEAMITFGGHTRTLVKTLPIT
jgi:hypothetical protein